MNLQGLVSPQLRPSACKKPESQLHWYEPPKLVHLSIQPPLSKAHSFTSAVKRMSCEPTIIFLMGRNSISHHNTCLQLRRGNILSGRSTGRSPECWCRNDTCRSVALAHIRRYLNRIRKATYGEWVL